MPSTQLDIEATLPAWNRLHNVDLIRVSPRHIPGRGIGLVANQQLSRRDGASDSQDSVTLLRIPSDLVLSREGIDEHAKVDGHFRELIKVSGRESIRRDACLFLLTQRVLAARPGCGLVSTPWTEYVQYLPPDVPVPTLWSELERESLRGTSLEPAVSAKIQSLYDEFDHLRETSSALPFWNALLWDDDHVTLADWFLVDAWYRSRSLELPVSGESMVPVLDLANHSPAANSYYDQDAGSCAVELILKPGVRMAAAAGDGARGEVVVVVEEEEVTISYGNAKSAAEMLFSYGFIDLASSTQKLTLPITPLDDDPLGRAKVHVFSGPRSIEAGLDRASGVATWTSPFAWLACINEEDGLAFRVLQDTSGGKELRVFWQDEDVTGRMGAVEDLVDGHPLSRVFRLRVVAMVAGTVASQLEELQAADANSLPEGEGGKPSREREGEREEGPDREGGGLVRSGCLDSSRALRECEASVLEAVAELLETQRSQLLTDETVVAYLGSMEISRNEQADDAASNQSEDFS